MQFNKVSKSFQAVKLMLCNRDRILISQLEFFYFKSLVKQKTKTNKNKKTKLDFCGSPLTHSLFSKNRQHWPPLGKHANEVLIRASTTKETHRKYLSPVLPAY